MRIFFSATLLTSLLLFSQWTLPALGAKEDAASLAGNPVIAENRHAGATDWQLTRVRADDSEMRSPWIEGYCSRQSVRAGESLNILVSTAPVEPF